MQNSVWQHEQPNVEATNVRRSMYREANGDLSEEKVEPIQIDTTQLWQDQIEMQLEPDTPKLQTPDQPTIAQPAPKPKKRPTLKGITQLSRELGHEPKWWDKVQDEFVGGIHDFVSNAIDGFGTVLGEDTDGTLRSAARLVPQIEATDPVGGHLVRTMTQYMMAMIPGLGQARAILGGGKVATVGAGILADAGADFFAFKGNQPKFVKQLSEWIPGLQELPFYSEMMQYIVSAEILSQGIFL